MIDLATDTGPKERPNKSQAKRESLAAQELAQRLVKMTPRQIIGLNLPEEIHLELLKAMNIKAHSGRKRHIKFVSGLIRESDDLERMMTLKLPKK